MLGGCRTDLAPARLTHPISMRVRLGMLRVGGLSSRTLEPIASLCVTFERVPPDYADRMTRFVPIPTDALGFRRVSLSTGLFRDQDAAAAK
jgi:hypothetical protein